MSVDLDRKVSIARYLPPVFGSLREMQQIAQAVDPEFNFNGSEGDEPNYTPIYKGIQQFINDCFVETAQESVIERWEKIIGLTTVKSDSLDERRKRILYYMSLETPYTEWMLKHVYLAGLLGEGNYKVTVDPVACTIEVLFNASKASQRDNILQLLSVLLPCNMALTVGFMGTPHDYMERFTHDQLAKYTHNQIRNDLQFVNN